MYFMLYSILCVLCVRSCCLVSNQQTNQLLYNRHVAGSHPHRKNNCRYIYFSEMVGVAEITFLLLVLLGDTLANVDPFADRIPFAIKWNGAMEANDEHVCTNYV